MSTSPLFNSTASLARKHSRVSLLAAGAAAAGMLGVAGASIGSAPMAHAAGNINTTADTMSQASSSHSNTSALDEVLGVHTHATLPAKQQPAPSHTSPRLTAVPTPAKAAPAKPAAKAAPAKAAPAAKPAVQHKAAQPTGPTKPYTIYDSVTPSSIPASQPAA